MEKIKANIKAYDTKKLHRVIIYIVIKDGTL